MIQRTQEQITQNWKIKENPLVSICCTTYNHEKFISEALEGFLMQQTDFPFEILIHDDASTDGTADIIREYEARYPDIIKPIYQTENQYSKGISISATFNWPRAKGKYIALCEGDDYWTDPLKLQKQVDFLEANEEYVVCYHDSAVVDQNGMKIHESILNTKNKRDASRDELKKGFKLITNTRCQRNIIREFPLELSFAFGGDKFTSSLLGAYGKGKYINDIKSCFRIHPHGVNRGVSDDFQKRTNHLRTRVALFLYYERIGENDVRNFYIREIFRLTSLLNENNIKRSIKDRILLKIKRFINNK